MTVEGEESLRTELQHLITDVRPNITKKIAEAREFGDLKENAEYHAAKAVSYTHLTLPTNDQV